MVKLTKNQGLAMLIFCVCILLAIITFVVMAQSRVESGTIRSKRDIYTEIVNTTGDVEHEFSGEDFLDADYSFSRGFSGQVYVTIKTKSAQLSGTGFNVIYEYVRDRAERLEQAFEQKGMHLVKYIVELPQVDGTVRAYSVEQAELKENDITVYKKS